jgi:hypothetical protein
MNRKFLIVGILTPLFLSVLPVSAQDRAKAKPKKRPCAGAKTIRDCPEPGCGGKNLDPELNGLKNIPNDKAEAAVLRTIAWMQALKNPKNFTAKNPDRTELRKLGEGQKITIVAWALAARSGSQESCNCYLSKAADTDNHIVLVDPDLKKPTLARNEKRDSETIEFTPRVRIDHANFTQEKLEPLIDPDWESPERCSKGKLLVRVTGYLMFDTEHFLHNPLKRHNNWEIHPVLKMEYCADGVTCDPENDSNWVNIETD